MVRRSMSISPSYSKRLVHKLAQMEKGLLGYEIIDSQLQNTVDRAENAIQLAMSSLEDELRHTFHRSTIPLNAESLHGSINRVSLSFASHIDKNLDSFDESSDRGYDRFHSRASSLDDDVVFDLVHPNAIMELKEIIERMVRSYERECLQVYSSVRRDTLDERLVILEVQKIEWKILDEKMKNWVTALKIAVGVLLNGEKRLRDSVFGELDEMKEICFNETAKGGVLQTCSC